MRVNPNQWALMLDTLDQVTAQENKAMQEVSTGKRLNLPSDDPAAMAILILNKASQAECDQYQQNISSVRSSLQTADSALSSVLTSLNRAITLGAEGANGTVSSADRSAIAGELNGIRDQILALANTTFNGSYIFGGARTASPPFVPSASDPSGVSYQGDSTITDVPIGDGVTVAANKPGDQLFSATGHNVFAALQDLTAALGNGTGIDTATESLRAAFDNLTSERVPYGNSMQQLDAGNTFVANDKLQFQAQENSLSGVNMAEAISRLTNAENARSATLAAASRIGQKTLIDYL